MKTMCPPSYHHNDFVATHALGHMMYGYIYIYIYIYLAVYIMSTVRKLRNFYIDINKW